MEGYFTPVDPLINLLKRYRSVYAASAVCAERRASLPIGSSRSKVTTANAKWATLAEERDRLFTQVQEAIAHAGFIASVLVGGCECDDCAGGITHLSSCAIHNEPAQPKGLCNCSPVKYCLTPEQIDQACRQIHDNLPNCGLGEHGISVIKESLIAAATCKKDLQVG